MAQAALAAEREELQRQEASWHHQQEGSLVQPIVGVLNPMATFAEN